MPDKIEPIGSTLKTDKNGFLINGTNKENIKGKWKEAVNELINSCIKNLGKENIHSIWIRGSVAKGMAKENPTKEDSSDLDSIILTNCQTKEIGKNGLEEISKEVKEKFPFLEKVELPMKNHKDALNDKDLAKTISMDIKKIIEKAKRKIEDSENNEEIKKKCKWAMNKIVRQGFILVMKKEKTFTRDLYPCYKTFSKHYPEKECEMKEALELAIYPTNDREKIYRIFDNLGSCLIEESKKQNLT